MIVCLCHGVNDRKIRSLASEGASTVAEVSRRCGAGTDCGRCKRHIKDLVHEVQTTREASQRVCSNARLPVLTAQPV